ncbi:glycosyltransferase family 2 protein [Bacteroides finegoldii]|jgi:glycosyltransferase involved in cell wall biosynthesis|uniref:glycosyltransferase family 2 protein n=1 Tax=Bacteroides finegoldii TaxID=338188 RepID=UPI00234D8D28|nr:glycosyltransferase family A protein [Bacteroides finegoldii]MDC7140966.1 glycosyltransferase family A protein [Bacteroides finegoldii]
MNKLLTIAVPAYNMELYLKRCLDSILLPKLQNSLEVILINDGSKDNTLSIARHYEKQYPEMLKVIDKTNGGWGSAINCAIQEATGKYFKILDADDWFDSKALVDFVSLLKNIDVDLVATSFSYEYDSRESKNDIYDIQLCDRPMLFREYIRICAFRKHLPMATITFKTQILKVNKIHVCDRYYADIDYNLTPLLFVHTIYFSQINLYKYYIGREGQSTSIAGYNSHIDDFLTLCKKIVTFYAENTNILEQDIRQIYLFDSLNIVRFSYYLLMSPTYSGSKVESLFKLKDLDETIKEKSAELYKLSNRIKIRKVIPYIYVWRKTGINLLKLRK